MSNPWDPINPELAWLSFIRLDSTGMSNGIDKLFTPFDIGGLSLKNRFIRTAAFEGMSQNGKPTPQLIEHHRRVSEGGVAMTTVAYCAVSKDGRTYDTQLLMRPSIIPGLKELTDKVHNEGAKASIQLGHCGDFSETKVIGTKPIGPSKRLNLYGLAFCRPMTLEDINRVVDDFKSAASMALEAGFDAVEVHAGHGYLLSQFLCPLTNKRDDEYGGSLENRLRFPLRVLKAVKEAVNGKAALLIKMNLDDGFKGGISLDDAIKAGQAFCDNGADALVTSGGFVSKAPLYMLKGEVPTRDMVKVQTSLFRKIGLTLFGRFFVKHYPFSELFFFDPAQKLLSAVDKPVILLGGIVSKTALLQASDAGFELFAFGRATIHDPDFVNHLQSGEVEMSECDHCNKCIATMDAGGVRCVCLD